MLKYNETNWRSEEGFKTHKYQISFEEIKSQSTIEEQKERAERLSLVKTFNKKEMDFFIEASMNFQKNNRYYYFNRNKKFHTTLLGFPVIEPTYHNEIRERIGLYCEEVQIKKMKIKFDFIRLGTKYEGNNTLKPIRGVSNGTVIAFGNSLHNRGFIDFGNKPAGFLLQDQIIHSLLGKKFRRRFPTVWSTMGHYTTDFKISTELEKLFNEYKNLDSDFFQMPCSEVELGSSHYKDLRDWKPIQKFSLAGD